MLPRRASRQRFPFWRDSRHSRHPGSSQTGLAQAACFLFGDISWILWYYEQPFLSLNQWVKEHQRLSMVFAVFTVCFEEAKKADRVAQEEAIVPAEREVKADRVAWVVTVDPAELGGAHRRAAALDRRRAELAALVNGRCCPPIRPKSRAECPGRAV